MIGTLGGETDGGAPEERAMAAEGADDTLVVVVRQLLAAKFERFEDSSDDGTAQIPL